MPIYSVNCYKDKYFKGGIFLYKLETQPRFLFGSGMSRTETTHSSWSPEVKLTMSMDFFQKYAGKGLGFPLPEKLEVLANII